MMADGEIMLRGTWVKIATARVARPQKARAALYGMRVLPVPGVSTTHDTTPNREGKAIVSAPVTPAIATFGSFKPFFDDTQR
jgi:hypothetical protein